MCGQSHFYRPTLVEGNFCNPEATHWALSGSKTAKYTTFIPQARACWLQRVRGQNWRADTALSFFYIFQRFLSAKRKECVGEARRMGALGLEILYCSESDSLVTRTWVTLSPSQLPTCSH